MKAAHVRVVYVLEMNVQQAESLALVSLKCTALCAPEESIFCGSLTLTETMFVIAPRRPSR